MHKKEQCTKSLSMTTCDCIAGRQSIPDGRRSLWLSSPSQTLESSWNMPNSDPSVRTVWTRNKK